MTVIKMKQLVFFIVIINGIFKVGGIDNIVRTWILPTIITHSIVAVSSAYGFRFAKETWKLWILSIACSILPDADVIGYRWLYIPTYGFFGHRGFFHSPFFAALLSIFIVGIFYRKEVIFSKQWWKYVLYFFILSASHGLLDALTNGGNGIALLSPITNERYFFPWTPIEVSPLSIKAFFSQRGFTVLISEIIWIWAPCLLFIIFLELKRRKYKYVKGFLLWKDNCKFYLSFQMHNYRFFQLICTAELIFVPECRVSHFLRLSCHVSWDIFNTTLYRRLSGLCLVLRETDSKS